MSLVSVNLDINQPIAEESLDELLKATPYLEDYLFKILTDLQDLAVLTTLSVVTVITTDHTVLLSEDVLLVDDDAAGGPVTINLPDAALRVRPYPYHIKKLGVTANVIVDGFGAQTIDGGATATLKISQEAISIITDGSNWFIV